MQISLTFYLLYLKFLILKAWFCSGSNFLKMVLFWPYVWQEYIRWECVHSVFKRNFSAYCRISLNIPIDLLNFHFNELIWRFQSRCSSKTTPRYLTLLQVLIFSPLILKFRCFVIFLLWSKNNNFSFTGIETHFVCSKPLKGQIKILIYLLVYYFFRRIFYF